MFLANPTGEFTKQKPDGIPEISYRVQYEAPTLEQFLVLLRAEGWQGEIGEVVERARKSGGARYAKIVFSLSGRVGEIGCL